MIDLNPTAAADRADFATRNPSMDADAPWLTWRTPLAIGTGLISGGSNLALAAGELLTPWAKSNGEAIDRTFGTNSAEWLDGQLKQTRDAAVANADISPFTYGRSGELVHGLTRFLGEAAAGAPAGPLGIAATAGSSEAVLAFRQALAAGQDEQTALLTSGVAGVGAAAASALPLMGKTFTESALRGFLLILEMNAVQRGLTGQVLENAGYADMAKQYEMLDGNALLTDAILGAAFGGIGHAIHAHFAPMADRIPTLVDAALVDAKARAVEGVGPGIPAETATRNAHVAAMVKAETDLLAGRPVDVSEQIDPARATFIPDPAVDRYNDVWRAAIEEEHGPAIAEAQRMQAEAFPPEPATVTPAATLDSIRAEIGWAERGGQIIRGTPDIRDQRGELMGGMPAKGEVVGRTKWIPKSDFWPERPDKSLSEKGAQAALDKAAAGEPLNAKETRFVDYAQQTLRDRGATDEALRVEARQERAAIQAESGVTDADLMAGDYGRLSPDERVAVERLAAHTSELEAQRNEIERINAEHAEHRGALEGGNRAPIAGEPRPSVTNAAEGRGVAQETRGGEGRANQQGQDPLAQARAILAERPDLKVIDDNGQAVPLRDLLGRADGDAAHSEEQARLIQVAVDCALRSAA